MRQVTLIAAAAATLMTAAAGTASATTVTFDGLVDILYDAPYYENGVTVTATTPGADLGPFGTPGTVHLDDAYSYTSGVMFTTGSVFDVLGFTFTSLGFAFFDEAPEVVGNILIRGFLDGAQVVRGHVTMSPVYGTVQNIVLDAAFAGLDAFSIEILYPNTEAWCDAPCGHIDLDSVTFAGVAPVPVPLPASGLMLGGVAAGLLAFGWRKRARAASARA